MGSELRLGAEFDARDDVPVATAEALMSLGDAAEPRRFVGFVAIGDGRFHLKRYRYATWGESLGLLGRGTFWGTAPELAEFEALQTLHEHGVPAVRPVAACAITQHGRLVAHALLTEAAPAAAVDLETRLRDPADPLHQDRGRRRALMRRLGQTLARMHAIPFAHRDLRARNILVAWEDGANPALWLLDCRKGGAGRSDERESDLASLDRDLRGRIPAGDRMTALRAYLAAGGDPKALVARIARARADVPAPRAV